MTPTRSLPTLIFIIVSLFLHSVSSLSVPIFNGYQILDLTSLTWEKFNLEAEPWTISPTTTSSTTTNCSSYPILGGYNILSSNSYFSRKYTGLTSHNILYYQIRYFIIDNWQSSDGIIVSFDSDTTTTVTPYFGLALSSTNLCGQAAYNDLAWYTRLGSVAHSSDSLTLKILSSISNPPSTASFGVRDISIVLGNTSSTPSDSYCSRAFDNQVYGTWGECQCTRGKYPLVSLLGILSCQSCDTSCADCFGSGLLNCYVCNDGYSYTTSGCTKCDSSCATCSGSDSNQCITCASGLWLQGNNTCTSTCNLPTGFSQQVDDFQLCQTNCSSGEYRLWDGTCSSDCSFPLVKQVIDDNKLCLKPCDDGEYIYPDGSCEAACDPYYVEKVIDSVLVCQYPCDFANGEFLSWNGDCLTTCSSPNYQRTENGITFCDACQPNYFSYPDGSCLAACDSPYKSKTINGSVFCYSDCASTEYISPDGSCKTSCDSYDIETTINSILTCQYPCGFGSGEFLSWNGNCIMTCSSPNYQRTDNGITSCDACQPNYFSYPDGSCLDTCDSPLKSKTINGSLFCYSDCDSSKYIYPDGSCETSCDAYYVEKAIGSALVCQYPCDFSNGEFLSWNGDCLTTCTSPNYQKTANNIVFCDACQPNYYQYPNGTCLDSCDSPLKSKTINGSLFCYSDCDPPNYLYSDGTCSSNCDSPYVKRIESIANFCNYPCATGFYLYLNNNTCHSSCNSPYIKSTQNNVDTCNFPCTDPAYPYLYSDGSCLATCNTSTYTLQTFDTIYLCQSKQTTTTTSESSSSSSEGEGISVESASEAEKTGSQVASVGVKIAAVLSSSNPKALSLASLDQMLMYIRYLSIGYPPKLLEMFHEEETGISVNFSPKFPESAAEHFEKYPLPENFEEYELDSSFFLNYWDNLSSLLIVLAVIVLLSFITRYTKRFHNLHLVLYRVKLIAKWDFFLMIFYASCDGITFFSSLQFRTMHFDSFTSSISAITCIVMVILGIFVLFRTFYIIRDIHQIKARVFPSSKKREALKKWEGYELLHQGYKRDSFLQQGFIFFFVSRTITFNFVIGYLFEYPLAQAILITSLSTIMLLYLGIKKPFEETRDLIQLMIIEGLLFVVNFCILILAILDYHNIEATKDRERIGDLIIVIKVIFVMLSIIFLVIDALISLYEIYLGFRRSKDKGIKAVLQLFLAFFVPDGMVIEEKELKRTKTFARFLTRAHTRAHTKHVLEHKPTIVVSDVDEISSKSPKRNQIISLENHDESLLNQKNPFEGSVRSNNTLQRDGLTPSNSTLLPLSSPRKHRSSLRFDEMTPRLLSPSTSRSRPATASLSERKNLMMISNESRNQGIIFHNNFLEDEEKNGDLPVIQSEVTQQDADREKSGFERRRNGKAFPTRFHEIAKKPIEFLPGKMMSAFKKDVKKPIEFLPGNMTSAFKKGADNYLAQQRQSIGSIGPNEQIIEDFFKEIEEGNKKEFSLSEEDYRDSPEPGVIEEAKSEDSQGMKENMKEEEKGCSTIIFEEVYEPSQKEVDAEDKKSEEESPRMEMDLDEVRNGSNRRKSSDQQEQEREDLG